MFDEPSTSTAPSTYFRYSTELSISETLNHDIPPTPPGAVSSALGSAEESQRAPLSTYLLPPLQPLDPRTRSMSPSRAARRPRHMPHRREQTIDPKKSFPDGCIPPEHKHRTLVLCFDGTGDQFDGDNSNVVKLCEMLKKDDAEKQLVYYQSGIGTYTLPGIVTPFTSTAAKVVDEMIAWNLDCHVKNGYEFLMQSYRPGDRICMFGFSRGAYTARALAGMLHKVGLLPPNNFQQVPFAYKMYTRKDGLGWAQSTAFKRAFSIDVEIEFIGVWDTVSSVGLIPRRLPFTTSNTIVRTFRHALALDERRAKFKANLWNVISKFEQRSFEELKNPPPTRAGTGHTTGTWSRKRNMTGDSTKDGKSRRGFLRGLFGGNSDVGAATGSDKQGKSDAGHSAAVESKAKQSIEILEKSEEELKNVLWGLEQYSPDELEDDPILSALERAYSERRKHSKPTDVLEVWFAGCHCDVGGGSVVNESPHALSRISLRWMIRECFKTDSGIMFDVERLKEIGLDAASLYPYVTPRPPPATLPEGTSIRSRNSCESTTRTLPTEVTAAETKSSPGALARLIPSRFTSWRKKKHKEVVEAAASPSSPEKEEKLVPNLKGMYVPRQAHVHGPLGELRKGTEEEEELMDCLSPAYDQLELTKVWWLLEVIPMEFKYQLRNTSVKWFGVNLGRPRMVPPEEQKENGLKVHRSVKMRMEAMESKRKSEKYRPRMQFHVTPTWVE